MKGLELRQLSRTVGERALVDRLSLAIAPGECLALLGPSGCGKTTTLRLLAGLDQPSHGQVWLNGEDITALPPGDRQVGMVFQSYALYPHLSVLDNLSLGLRVRGVPSAEREQRIAATSALLKLEELLGRKPAQLSGGQRQRVALARALLRRPRLMLLDEPMSNLDAQLREELRPELRRLLCGGEPPVVYVTHDQQEALGMADRIAVLAEGKLQQIGTPSQLLLEPSNLFVAGFLGRPAINLFPARDGKVLGLRPQHLRFGQAGGLPVQVQRSEWWGHERLFWLHSESGVLRLLAHADQQPGAAPQVTWEPRHALWFDQHTGERLSPEAAGA
ncbi:MAG: ABC transporter ATP-binding protein [Synechococcaceae cyanobacterium]